MPSEIANVVFPKKPPKYWIAAKEADGLTPAAWGRIWWRNYTESKRFTAWLAASDEEWREHGLRCPV